MKPEKSQDVVDCLEASWRLKTHEVTDVYKSVYVEVSELKIFLENNSVLQKLRCYYNISL